VSTVDIYWLPLGAGGSSVVRFSGRVFEGIRARRAGRAPLDIYHAALEVTVPEGRSVIELTPVPSAGSPDRGAVAEGCVGSSLAGRIRVFRYELRCWREGSIPDAEWAVDSPRRISEDPAAARAVLERVPRVPMAVWGRDEMGAGEMWTSNSVISWLLVVAGIPVVQAGPPAGGTAPGWQAGITVADLHRDLPMSV
jgi:hypothetical protein